MSNLFDKVINEALNGGIDYHNHSPEADAAYRTYQEQCGLASMEITPVDDFLGGWNACMDYLRTNTDVLGDPALHKQINDEESAHIVSKGGSAGQGFGL